MTIYRALSTLLLAGCALSSLHAATDLDPIIRSTPAGGVIRLEAGSYFTRGVNESGSANPGAQLAVGVAIYGKGMGKTEIVLVNPEVRSLNVLWGLGNNTVQDVSIDCGKVDGVQPIKRNGIYFGAHPRQSKALRVAVRRPYGSIQASREGFGIIGHGNVKIVDCSIQEIQGDYVQGINIAGTGTVEGCRVYLPTVGINDPITSYGCGWGTNLTFRNNLSYGGSSGFYYDTGDVRNLTIEGNILSGCSVGVQLKNQFQPSLEQLVRLVQIKGNSIHLKADGSMVVGVALINTRLDGLEIDHNSGCIDDVSITQNFISYAPGEKIPQVPVGFRKGVAVVSNCSSPIKGKAGINGVLMASNQYQEVSGENWVHRNKWGNAAGVRVAVEQSIEWRNN